MERLIALDPKNADVIFPYIGGEEVNTSPTHAHHRYVISFGERDEAECRRNWPDLMRIVEEKVKPERLQNNDKGGRTYWCRFLRPRPELYATIAGMERVLVGVQTSKFLSISFQPVGLVYSHMTIVFALDSISDWAVLNTSWN